MSWQTLPDWIEQNEGRLSTTCAASGERLLAAADEVSRLWTALSDSRSVELCRSSRALQGLLDLLLELPQTRLLATELLCGVRLHPEGQPTAEVVARTLKVVHNIFIQSASSERDDEEELALRLLTLPDSSTEKAVVSDQGGHS